MSHHCAVVVFPLALLCFSKCTYFGWMLSKISWIAIAPYLTQYKLINTKKPARRTENCHKKSQYFALCWCTRSFLLSSAEYSQIDEQLGIKHERRKWNDCTNSWWTWWFWSFVVSGRAKQRSVSCTEWLILWWKKNKARQQNMSWPQPINSTRYYIL